MPRLSFKPDSSFFRKIVIGAVGARAVCENLARYGHQLVELERGSTNSKLWKDVKRKRVRIPDLVCVHCGTRVECRAKTEAELTMSHSPTDAERAWDFGMVDADWIAFPVCQSTKEVDWTSGKLQESQSCWREKRWIEWEVTRHINYFTVEAFHSHLHAQPHERRGGGLRELHWLGRHVLQPKRTCLGRRRGERKDHHRSIRWNQAVYLEG